MIDRKPATLTTLLLRTCLLALTAALGAAALYAWRHGYGQVTAQLAAGYGYGDDPGKLRTLLTPARFAALRAVLTGMGLVAVGTTAWAWHRGQLVANALHQTQRYGRCLAADVRTFRAGIPRAEQGAVATLWLSLWVAQVYLAFRLPFHVDERFTYLYFVQPGWLVSLAYYPGPNNHILFTLLCNATDLLLDDPLRTMKVTALAVGGVLPPVFWAVVRRHFGAAPAWLATAAFAAADQVFYYAMQGRGYSLLALWTVVATYAAVQVARDGAAGWRPYGMLGLSCVLGFYTVPVFLYPFVGLALYLVATLARRRAYRQLARLLVTGAGVVAVTGLLYLPVILVNGWKALTGNAWVARLPWPQFREAFPRYLQGVAAGLWYGSGTYRPWLTGVVLALVLGVVLTRRAPVAVRHWAGLAMVQAGVAVLLPTLQGVLPPGRTSIYLAVFAFPVAAWGLVKAVSWVPLAGRGRSLLVVTVGTVLCAGTVVRYVQATHNPAFGLYDSLDRVAALLYERQAQSVFTRNYEYNLCIRFQFQTNGRALRVDTGTPEPGFRYEYVVVPRGEDFPQTLPRGAYQPLYRDPEAVVFVRANHADWGITGGKRLE
jgi:hypothetical protein